MGEAYRRFQLDRDGRSKIISGYARHLLSRGKMAVD
jgi:hypothetical protein